MSLCSTRSLFGSIRALSILSFLAVKWISSVLDVSKIMSSCSPLAKSVAISFCSALIFFFREVDEVVRDRSSIYDS